MMIDQIKQDMIAALKAGEAVRLSVLRMLVSELNYKKINVQRELVDQDVLEVVGREIKKRKEAIVAYRQGGRDDQAKSEEEELQILQAYMPAQMSESDLRIKISDIRKQNSDLDFSGMMKLVAPMFKGIADGQTVASIVKELVNG